MFLTNEVILNMRPLLSTGYSLTSGEWALGAAEPWHGLRAIERVREYTQIFPFSTGIYKKVPFYVSFTASVFSNISIKVNNWFTQLVFLGLFSYMVAAAGKKI